MRLRLRLPLSLEEGQLPSIRIGSGARPLSEGAFSAPSCQPSTSMPSDLSSLKTASATNRCKRPNIDVIPNSSGLI